MAEFTPVGQGNLNTVLGAIGTAGVLLPGLFGHGIMGANAMGAACGTGICSENQPVNRYELDLMIANASKDAEIGQLKADKYTDEKITAVYANLEGQLNDLAAEVRSNKDAQCAVNTQQAVYNGTVNATLNCINGQISQLFGLTKLVVPNTSVCPGWGNVTITPATTTTAAAG